MPRPRAVRRWIFLSCAVLAGALAPPAADGAAKAPVPVAVIVHPQVPVDELSLADLRKVFLGQRPVWSSELMITLLTPPRGSPEREVLLHTIYQQRNETQYQQYWINQLFADGAPTVPKGTGSPEMSASLVREIPGAIALVASDRIPQGVKVLRIDGKLPGESGYPLVASGGKPRGGG
jgi:ABC-type phosphate transport system substrate-binding protein